ncbi:MAG: DUF4860 domain-containing protein [Firmicutes bacterium]|nr:DUF4860 domain-containing protein [Bacillota bacterium]
MRNEKFVIIVIFGIFAIFSMVMIFASYNIYSKILFQSEENEKARTVLCYVSNKIHSGDAEGKVYLKHINEVNSLVIEEENNGIVYNTYIYYHDGYLKEYVQSADKEADLGYGDKLIELSGFKIKSEKNGLITIKMSDSENNSHSMSITLRSGGDKIEQLQEH